MGADRNHRRPQWARYQIVGGFISAGLGVGLFIAQGIDHLLWGVDLDFGALPWGLTVLGVYVLFNVSLPELLGRSGDTDKDNR